MLERDNIKPDDEFRDYEEWDSLAYLALIAMIDDNYDIVIPGEEFAKTRSSIFTITLMAITKIRN